MFRNMNKVRFNQSDEELAEVIDTKFKMLSGSCSAFIKKHWRRKGADLRFPMLTDELVYVISWLENLSTEDFCELLMLDFVKWNIEFFRTADWMSTIRVSPPENTLNGIHPNYRKDGAFQDPNSEPEPNEIVFRDKDKYEQWLRDRKITEELKDRREIMQIADPGGKDDS